MGIFVWVKAFWLLTPPNPHTKRKTQQMLCCFISAQMHFCKEMEQTELKAFLRVHRGRSSVEVTGSLHDQRKKQQTSLLWKSSN